MVKKVLISADIETGHFDVSDENTNLDVNEMIAMMVESLVLICQEYDEDPKDYIDMMVEAALENQKESKKDEHF